MCVLGGHVGLYNPAKDEPVLLQYWQRSTFHNSPANMVAHCKKKYFGATFARNLDPTKWLASCQNWQRGFKGGWNLAAQLLLQWSQWCWSNRTADGAQHEFDPWKLPTIESVLFEALFIWNLLHCSVGNSAVGISLELLSCSMCSALWGCNNFSSCSQNKITRSPNNCIQAPGLSYSWLFQWHPMVYSN